MLSLALMIAVSQEKAIPPPSPTGVEVLQKMHANVRAASPVEGFLESVGPRGDKATMEFKAMYPKLFRGTMTMFGIATELIWNDQGLHMYMPSTQQYQLVKRESGDMGLVGLESLFGDEEYFREAGVPKKAKFEGKDALALPVTRFSGKASRKVVLFVDAGTFLPLGYDEEGTGGGGTSHSVYKKLARAKLTKQDFDWKKPRS